MSLALKCFSHFPIFSSRQTLFLLVLVPILAQMHLPIFKLGVHFPHVGYHLLLEEIPVMIH